MAEQKVGILIKVEIEAEQLDLSPSIGEVLDFLELHKVESNGAPGLKSGGYVEEVIIKVELKNEEEAQDAIAKLSG